MITSGTHPGARRYGRSVLFVVLAAAVVAFALAIGRKAESVLPEQKRAANGSDSSPKAPEPTPTKARPTPTPDRQAIPRWAQGKTIRRVPVQRGDKVIALTFDDGPWPTYTKQILQILDENDVKATFYMVGSVLSAYPKIGRQVRDAGHAIGNHSWSHPLRTRHPSAEVSRTDAAIRRILGVKSTTFRPPYGAMTNGMAREAMKRKQAVMIWSADSSDWKRPGASRIISTIMRQASPGGVALFHDGGGYRNQTVAALPIIIQSLRARGYRFVTVPELLKLRYVAPAKTKSSSQAKKPIKSKGVIPHTKDKDNSMQ